MSDVKVNLRIGALNKLMRSAAVQAEVDKQAQAIAAAAGPNFEAVSRPHRWTARAYVQPTGAEGMREQARTAALERALASRVR